MTVERIGPWTAGEIPAPLSYTFTGIDLSSPSYAARLNLQRAGGDVEELEAQITDGSGGTVTYTWTDADLATTGMYWVQFWVGNGTNRFASPTYHFKVEQAVGTAPDI